MPEHKLEALEGFRFRWLENMEINAAFPSSITLFLNHLK